MNKLKNFKKYNQNGFSVVEVLLVIIVIGIIGAVGFYVYKAKQNTDKSLTNPVSSSVEKKQKTENVSKPAENKTSSQKYLEIKEWGVKVPIDSTVSGLSYVLENSFSSAKKDTLVRFSSDDLRASSTQANCTANQVYLERGMAEDKVSTGNYAENETPPTFKKTYDAVKINPDEPNGRAVKVIVGDYYYVPPNFGGASCSSNETEGNKAFKANSNIIKALLKMEKL